MSVAHGPWKAAPWRPSSFCPTMGATEPLELIIDRAIEDKTFPGIACGVWIEGRPRFVRCAGNTADPLSAETEGFEPVGEKTLFDAASLTKPLATALLVLKAAEAGFLDMERRVGHYVPDVCPRTARIPVSALLTHTSGLPAIPSIERRFPSPPLLERELAAAELLAIEPEADYGEHVVYSCTGYMLLGLLLERVFGELIGNLYRREIAGPLRLPRAGFAPGISPSGEPLAISGAAPTEFCAWRGRRIRGQVHDESAYCLGGHAGNAGLFLSLEDAFITGSMLLQGGSTSEGRPFLKETSIADIMTEKTQGLEERRSFGFRLHDEGTFEGSLWEPSSLGHTGFTGTSVFIAPDRGLLAVALTNRVYYGREETAQKIIDFRKAFHSFIRMNYC